MRPVQCAVFALCAVFGAYPAAGEATERPLGFIAVDACFAREAMENVYHTHQMYGKEAADAAFGTFREEFGACETVSGEATLVEVLDTEYLVYPEGEREVSLVSFRFDGRLQLWYTILPRPF